MDLSGSAIHATSSPERPTWSDPPPWPRQRGLQIDGALGDFSFQAFVQLPQRFFGPLALGNIDADADQAGPAAEDDAAAGQKIRRRGAVLCPQRRLDRRFSLLENFLDLYRQERPVALGKEFSGPHMHDFVGSIAGNLLEVAIPPQELAVLVVQIEHAGHALDDRVGERALGHGDDLGLAALFLACGTVQSERDIARGLPEQRHFRVLKEILLVRIDRQHAGDLARQPDRKRGRRPKSAPRGLGQPRPHIRIGCKILTDMRLAIAKGFSRRAAALRVVIRPIDLNGLNIAAVIAGHIRNQPGGLRIEPETHATEKAPLSTSASQTRVNSTRGSASMRWPG